MPVALPATLHLTTPHGVVSLWWLPLPDGEAPDAQRRYLRQQVARILDRQFPVRSLARIHWPPGAQHPPDLGYAMQALAASANGPATQAELAPDLWLSWSYLPQHPALPPRALLAIAPMPVGVDVSVGSLLPLSGWTEVLQLYGGMSDMHSTALDAQNCARLWSRIEAADKCLRAGLREWSAAVAADRAQCTFVELPLPHADLAATLAWLPPALRND